MKSLLTAILCLAAVATTRAAETPGQYTGRWAGISDFWRCKDPDQSGSRTLLTFEVNPDGSITNGAIRDFDGVEISTFSGQLDAKGRLTNTVTGLFPYNTTALKIDLSRTTGTGTYYTLVATVLPFRSTIRFWREEKPPKESAATTQNSNGVTPPPRGSGHHGLVATMSNPWLASQTNRNTQSTLPLPPEPPSATPAP